MQRKKNRNRLVMRNSQKQKLRMLQATGSVLLLAAGFFVYTNLSSVENSKATATTSKPDYHTTATIVPERLLVKTPSGAHTKRSRAAVIKPDQYLNQ